MTHYDFDDYELVDSRLDSTLHWAFSLFRFIALALGPFHLHFGFSLAPYPGVHSRLDLILCKYIHRFLPFFKSFPLSG